MGCSSGSEVQSTLIVPDDGLNAQPSQERSVNQSPESRSQTIRMKSLEKKQYNDHRNYIKKDLTELIIKPSQFIKEETGDVYRDYILKEKLGEGNF